jgi:hypothetical protein
MHGILRTTLLLATAALLTVPLAVPSAHAQGAPDDEPDGLGIRFNGLGRSYIQQADLGGTLLDTDTTTVETVADGEFLLDLAVNAQPNAVTEVQGIIRLRNEFGGFFGSGVTLEVRELWARGIVAGAFRYRLGDMDVALTPYTLFLPEEDGVVNEPEIFEPQKEIIYYDEFYTGFNERRLQGGKLEFGLTFDQAVQAVDAMVFLARLRATDFTSTPSRFIGGGRLAGTSMDFGGGVQVRLGSNLAYTWDDLSTGTAERGMRNVVTSVDADVTLLARDAFALRLVGEGGYSGVRLRDDGDVVDEETLFDETDTFFEVGLASRLNGPSLGLSAMFVNVGPDFFSGAAQSKRVDYARQGQFFNRLGNARDLRDVTLFDLSRDQAIYTFRIADQLMPYDPRYGNVMPYGRATPNRRGVRLGAAYAPAESFLDAALDVALLSEIRGQGTPELKDFVQVRAEADVAAGEVIGWERALGATLGLQYESTQRGGSEFETVDLTSLLLELGLSAEVYDRLDVLLGLKHRTSDGRDFVPDYEGFNDIFNFPAPFVTDDEETLLGAGIRYRFARGSYLTLQAQRYSYADDATPDDDYSIGQVFALYSMSF